MFGFGGGLGGVKAVVAARQPTYELAGAAVERHPRPPVGADRRRAVAEQPGDAAHQRTPQRADRRADPGNDRPQRRPHAGALAGARKDRSPGAADGVAEQARRHAAERVGAGAGHEAAAAGRGRQRAAVGGGRKRAAGRKAARGERRPRTDPESVGRRHVVKRALRRQRLIRSHRNRRPVGRGVDAPARERHRRRVAAAKQRLQPTARPGVVKGVRQPGTVRAGKQFGQGRQVNGAPRPRGIGVRRGPGVGAGTHQQRAVALGGEEQPRARRRRVAEQRREQAGAADGAVGTAGRRSGAVRTHQVIEGRARLLGVGAQHPILDGIDHPELDHVLFDLGEDALQNCFETERAALTLDERLGNGASDPVKRAFAKPGDVVQRVLVFLVFLLAVLELFVVIIGSIRRRQPFGRQPLRVV